MLSLVSTVLVAVATSVVVTLVCFMLEYAIYASLSSDLETSTLPPGPSSQQRSRLPSASPFTAPDITMSRLAVLDTPPV